LFFLFTRVAFNQKKKKKKKKKGNQTKTTQPSPATIPSRPSREHPKRQRRETFAPYGAQNHQHGPAPATDGWARQRHQAANKTGYDTTAAILAERP